MKTYISWSGGKDSTASIILAYEKGIKVDGVVMSEVMFSHKDNISGEYPEHIEWVYNIAIPIIENQFGFKVIILKDKSDYLTEFYRKIGNRTKHPERVGKYSGFFLNGACVGNNRLKMRPLRNFFKNCGECEQIVGIAINEPKRLERLKNTPNKRSLLAEYNITEEMTYDICRKYNLLSPTYCSLCRGGCWFCPNQSIKTWARLKRKHPELWNKLKELSQEKNLVSQRFRYDKSFSQVENQVDTLNSQINLFDLIEEKSLTNEKQ